MILSEVPSSERIFIDTNIFLYSAFGHPIYGKICRDFLKRAEKNDVMGVTSDLVLNEVFYRLMIAEIAEIQGIEAKKVAGEIKRRPEVIGKLKIVWSEMELIDSFGICLLNTTTYPEFIRLSREYFLMPADAAHLATMKANGIVSIASNDGDFLRVPWLRLWRPQSTN